MGVPSSQVEQHPDQKRRIPFAASMIADHTADHIPIRANLVQQRRGQYFLFG
jgi:hypothetical protein